MWPAGNIASLRKLALSACACELKLVRKPPKVSRGCGGVARVHFVHVDAGGPGRLTFVVKIGVGGVVQLPQGVPGAVRARIRPVGASGSAQGGILLYKKMNSGANGETQGF